MDNITHGLIGFALAKAVAEQRQAAPAKARALIWGAVVASNLPDLDLLVSFFADDRKLAYLLHHRGHSHTLLGVLPLSALAAWFGAKVARFKATTHEYLELLAVAVLGGLLHILFDGFNNYGVHPFYPFDNGWHYGDTLFIIEPWLFGPLLVLLGWSTRSRWSRWLALALALGVVVLALRATGLARVNLVLALGGMLGGGLLQAALQRRWPRHAGWLALGCVFSSVAIFALGGARASALARRELFERGTEFRPVDVVTTPTPGNPLCWNLLVAERSSSELRLRRAVVSLAPSWFAPAVCRFRSPPHSTAVPRAAPASLLPPAARGVLLDAEYDVSLAELRSRYVAECRVRAFLQFARLPFLAPATAQRRATLIGDLRYDNSAAQEFAELALDPSGGESCPKWLPPWEPPRLELVQPSER